MTSSNSPASTSKPTTTPRPSTSSTTSTATAADSQLWDDEFRLARKHIEAHDYGAAESILRGIYSDPKFTSDGSPGILLNLALCRQKQGDFDGAISFAEESLDMTKVEPEY